MYGATVTEWLVSLLAGMTNAEFCKMSNLSLGSSLQLNLSISGVAKRFRQDTDINDVLSIGMDPPKEHYPYTVSLCAT